MIKPILIPTDKARLCILNYKGELSEFKPEMKGAPNDDAFILEDTKDISINPQHIILIDTEAEIVEGSYYFANGGIRKCIRVDKSTTCPYIHLNAKGEELGDFETWSGNVIAISEGTTSPDNIDIDLPQLSSQSIQLLINYYNEHKCMPESVEVNQEEDWVNESYGIDNDGEEIESNYCYYKPKLNQQGEVDITIPEVEESVSDAFDRGFTAGHNAGVKIGIEGAKENMYTEEEVRTLFKAVGGGCYEINELSAWFEENKKK